MTRWASLSLLTKLLLATSVALTILFGLTGGLVLRHAGYTASQGMADEVRASLQAYEALWRARAETLSSVSLVLSAMSDVRAAFGTGDAATIRDTAGELWARVSRDGAFLLVADPEGHVIAALGGTGTALPPQLDVVRLVRPRFPRQATGFLQQGGGLYQAVLTPVYVESGRGPALLNVLVAGYPVDTALTGRLKQSTQGSEFLFSSLGPPSQVIASTLPALAAQQVVAAGPGREGVGRVTAAGVAYASLATPLPDVQGRPLGELRILRSFAAADARVADLQRDLALIWLTGALLGLGLSYALARRITGPVRRLARAAEEVAQHNYAHRVPVEGRDELGRLAEAFNGMCVSLEQARAELIRQERLNAVSRLSSSLLHDLRNPLAAIYGGAEMMVDEDLSPPQVHRLAGNIYRASRQMQRMLQDLADVSRGKVRMAEPCRLREVVGAACEAVTSTADAQAVTVRNEVPDGLELPLERARMERVFLNLFSNAIEAMPDGGLLRITAERANGSVTIAVEDTGPGIAADIRPRLFQPFETFGKRSGLGLGLALSRQAVLDHGGDLWAETRSGPGACFRLRLQVP